MRDPSSYASDVGYPSLRRAQRQTQWTCWTATEARCLGLATGDALGTTLEFSKPGTFEPIHDMEGGGPFKLQPGDWTDDTSMALCLAESLIECGDFDPVDQLTRYVRWMREGYLSSNGVCFDIGGTVHAALDRFERSGEPWCGSTDERSAGNGSIMRLAPVPLFFAHAPEIAIARSADSSRTTHGAKEAVDACRYMAGLIIGALQGKSKEELLAPLFTPVPGLWGREPLAPKVHAVAEGSFLRKEPPEIRGSGYVVESLEAALWAFGKSTSFEHGALSRSTWAGMPTRRERFTARSPAPTTGLRVFRNAGGRNWLVGR